jgi:hypothetical protein
MLKLTVFGGRHFSSLQVWNLTVPLTFVLALAFIFIICTNSTFDEY